MTALALLLIAAASPVAAFAPSGLALRGTVRPAQCGEGPDRRPCRNDREVFYYTTNMP